jgi:lysophospholipase L1-like esterase
MKKAGWIVVLLVLGCSVLAACVDRTRRVSLVGDSLFGCAQDTIVNAINNNDGMSVVSTQYVKGGTTAYDNPINEAVRSEGVAKAFGNPDVVLFSFATNDMMTVAKGNLSLPSAIQAMQNLIDQAVESGANCIVMLESSHRFAATFPHSEEFAIQMGNWFDYWHQQAGANEHKGRPYQFLLADISGKIHADMNTYLGDIIHFNKAGAGLAASALVETINMCPPAPWRLRSQVSPADAECSPDIEPGK